MMVVTPHHITEFLLHWRSQEQNNLFNDNRELKYYPTVGYSLSEHFNLKPPISCI